LARSAGGGEKNMQPQVGNVPIGGAGRGEQVVFLESKSIAV